MWRNRSILLCRAEATRDGNVDRLGREILDGFRAAGWKASDVVVSPQSAAGTEAQVAGRIASGEFDIVMSVQEMGMISGPAADALMARGGVRRLYWALDHPYSCWSSVAKLPANTIVTYPTRSNIDCCRRYLRSDLTPFCVPHAAARREAKPWNERIHRAVFVGNAPKEPPEQTRREWPKKYPPLWAGVLEGMAQHFESEQPATLESLAEMAIREKGQNPASVKQSDFMLLLSTFDVYAWSVIRLKYLAAFQNLPVTLVGQRWDQFAHGSMRLVGPLPTAEARALMADAKLILNLQSPWFRSHERIYEGMAAGCAVAAVGTGVLANVSARTDVPADKTAIAYLGAPDEAGARLSALLDDDTGLQAMAEAGLAEQRAHHTWENRVRTLLEQVEQAG